MRVGIIGTGAYGLALANILIKNKNKVIMWSHNKEELNLLDKERKTSKLEGYRIPEEIQFTDEINKTIIDNDLIVIAVPAFAFENVIKTIKKYVKKEPILIATKGIQQDTCLFLNEVLNKHINNEFAVISGPTFASDIVKEVPIGLSLATTSKGTEKIIKKAFLNNTTKLRTTKDVIGIEICGAIKNVMAIASGMLEGMGVTDSTRALFLTESMNDIKELIEELKGDKKTILSFAGFGDILMTCTSKTSRNFSYGYLIGKGASIKEIEEYKKNNTIEGIYTLKSINQLVKRNNLKIPIINLISDIIEGKKEKEEILSFLIEK